MLAQIYSDAEMPHGLWVRLSPYCKEGLIPGLGTTSKELHGYCWEELCVADACVLISFPASGPRLGLGFTPRLFD